jgi:hypothetical protein
MKLGQRLQGRGLARITVSLREGRLARYADRLVALGVDPSRTLVVSGFWRSGTTWLQESLAQLLGAKTVFEPFHFEVPAAWALLSRNQPVVKPSPVLELHMPYCGDAELSGELRAVFAGALRGTLAGRGTRLLRTDPRECLRRRVLVKLVRGHLCLRAAQRTFGMPIIHVYRDPRGVVASVLQTGWDWLFDHLRLAEQLLEPRDGRAAAFEPWREAIEEYDAQDRIARLAAYWAITERYLRDSLLSGAGGSGRCLFVSYEELCRKREDFLHETLARLDLPAPTSRRRSVLDRESLSTSESRRGATLEDRLLGWRKQLTPAQSSTIAEIARRFGLADRLFDGPLDQGPAERPPVAAHGALR